MTNYDRWKLAYPPEWDDEDDYDDGTTADIAYEAARDDALCDELDAYQKPIRQ